MFVFVFVFVFEFEFEFEFVFVFIDTIWRQVVTLMWMTSFQKRTHLEPK